MTYSALDVGAPQAQDKTGFGTVPPRSVDLLYQPRMGGGTGSVTTKKEIGLMVTDFFDYGVDDASGVPQPVTNYFWEINQNLFNNNATFPTDLGEETWCRVRSLKVWVLPQKGFRSGGPEPQPTTNADAMYTVNVQTPGVAIEPAVPPVPPATNQRAFAMNTQVTNVLPQIDTFWKCVFSCNLQQTFKSGVARPFIQPFGPAARSQAQCLFQMSIVDPVTGEPYKNDGDSPIRVKVCLVVDQPISTLNQAGVRVFRNEEFTSPSLEQNGAAYLPPTPAYVQMNLKSVLDNMR